MNKEVTKKVVATFTSVATVAMMTTGAFMPLAAGAAEPEKKAAVADSTVPVPGSEAWTIDLADGEQNIPGATLPNAPLVPVMRQSLSAASLAAPVTVQNFPIFSSYYTGSTHDISNLGGLYGDIAYKGNYAYAITRAIPSIGAGYNSLKVIDISNPASPVKVFDIDLTATYPGGYYCGPFYTDPCNQNAVKMGVSGDGNKLFVYGSGTSPGTGTLLWFDISAGNEANPQFVAMVQDNSIAFTGSMGVFGNDVYFGNNGAIGYQGDIRVWRANDNTQTWTSAYYNPSYCFRGLKSFRTGQYMNLTGFNACSGFALETWVFSYDSLGMPQLATVHPGSVYSSTVLSSNGSDRVYARIGSVAAGTTTTIWDSSNPLAPVLLGSVQAPPGHFYNTDAGGDGAVWTGHDLYLVDVDNAGAVAGARTSVLKRFDVSNPAVPVLTGEQTISVPGSAADVVVNESAGWAAWPDSELITLSTGIPPFNNRGVINVIQIGQPISPCASAALTSAGLIPEDLTAAQLAQLEAQCTSDPSQVIVVPSGGSHKGGIKPNPTGTCFVIVGEGANVSGGIHCKKAGYCDVLMASNTNVSGGIKDMKDVYVNGTGVSVSGGIHNAASFILGENAEIAVSGGIKGITQFFKVLANSVLTASGGITCAGAAVTQDGSATLTVSGTVACGPLVALELPSSSSGNLLALAAAALAAGLGVGLYARRRA